MPWPSGPVVVSMPEVADLVDRQRIAHQMQYRIQQHRRMAVRKNEAVTVPPGRIGRVVPHDATPQHLRDIGHAERCARVAGIGLLNGVHGQGADGVGKILGCGHA